MNPIANTIEKFNQKHKRTVLNPSPDAQECLGLLGETLAIQDFISENKDTLTEEQTNAMTDIVMRYIYHCCQRKSIDDKRNKQ